MPNNYCRRVMLTTLVLLLGSVTGCSGSEPVQPAPVLRATSGNNQSATVGAALPLPLQVIVESNGTPLAGASVTWRTSRGTILPAQSITVSDGSATATWTMSTTAGADTAYAQSASGATPVVFTATALAGAVTAIGVYGDRAMTDTSGSRALLYAVAHDRYLNVITGQAFTWTVQSGPVTLSSVDSVAQGDRASFAHFASRGAAGDAVIRAMLAGTQLSKDDTLTVYKFSDGVLLRTDTLAFVSMRNKTRPAVDTIAVGGTLTWFLDHSLASDEADGYSVVSVGTPAFQGHDFAYYQTTSVVSATFTAPGTYNYTDSYHPSATGTVVVR